MDQAGASIQDRHVKLPRIRGHGNAYEPQARDGSSRATYPSPYPPEFRAEAVRLLRTTGKTPQQVADDLGVSRQSVANWARQADLDDGRRDDGLTTAERDELRRLRREVRDLREEREILRKAAAFFARETDRR